MSPRLSLGCPKPPLTVVAVVAPHKLGHGGSAARSPSLALPPSRPPQGAFYRPLRLRVLPWGVGRGRAVAGSCKAGRVGGAGAGTAVLSTTRRRDRGAGGPTGNSHRPPAGLASARPAAGAGAAPPWGERGSAGAEPAAGMAGAPAALTGPCSQARVERLLRGGGTCCTGQGGMQHPARPSLRALPYLQCWGCKGCPDYLGWAPEVGRLQSFPALTNTPVEQLQNTLCLPDRLSHSLQNHPVTQTWPLPAPNEAVPACLVKFRFDIVQSILLCAGSFTLSAFLILGNLAVSI